MIAVVGGGISGLSAAWHLAAAGADVVVFEAAAQVGGKVRSGEIAGVTVDVGAEAMLAARPEGVGLVAELGLETIAPLTTAASVRAGGVIRPLPTGTMMGIPADVAAARASGVLTEHALARIEAEPDAEPLPPLREDVAVGALVRDRLGNEVADRLVEPLLGGVYAGRADDLSLRATIPAVAAALADGGSLVAAARRLVAAAPPRSGPVFASVPGGLGSVPVALAASGRFEVRTGVTVRALRRDGSGFSLDCGAAPHSYTLHADQVVVAVPAPKAARIVGDVAPEAAAGLAAITTASVAIVTFAFDPSAVDLPSGSGLLIGAREGLSVKGVTISSQKWPLPTDLVVLRASIGRAGETHLLQRPDDDLIRLVRNELGTVLGIAADPLDAMVTRWGGGLPQYEVGHVERVAAIRAAVEQVPGLAVCGAGFDGVGIPACIASARAAATRLGQ